METTIWICTGIIVISIVAGFHAIGKDIVNLHIILDNYFNHIEKILEEIRKSKKEVLNVPPETIGEIVQEDYRREKLLKESEEIRKQELK